jgi:hypothetical protein
MFVYIKPKTETIIKEYVTSAETHVIDSISISVTDIKLNAYAVIETIFYSQGKYVKQVSDLIQGDSYTNWADDKYIVDYILKKYELSLPSAI